MPEFKRSRLERNNDDQITKKTIIMGFVTVLLIVIIVVFGLQFLIKFSVFLGQSKSKNDNNDKELVLPPSAPRLVLPYEATNSSTISITGVSEANIDIELLKNDVSVGKTQSSNSGEFSFNNIELDKGSNNFSAVAISGKGGSSQPSEPVNIIFNDQPPSLKMLNPSEDSLNVDSADFDVIGQSDKGVSVLVNGHVAPVDNDGKFKLKVQLNAGKNNIEIDVKNDAGNETKKTINITYDI